MSETTNTTSSKAPTHIAYQLLAREGGKVFWDPIGAAWPNADGKGFNIQLDAIPFERRITIRVPSEKKD